MVVVTPAARLDFSPLPPELQRLAPLIARYAEGDDVDRSFLLEAASDEELRQLSTAPEGLWAGMSMSAR